MKNAIEKLKSEMIRNSTNSYIQVVGEFLLHHLNENSQNSQDTKKNLIADKTIAKSLEIMKKAAEKKKVGNCAVLTDQEGFGVVLKYFGIEPGADIPRPVGPEPKPKISKPSKIDFDINLEDLL